MSQQLGNGHPQQPSKFDTSRQNGKPDNGKPNATGLSGFMRGFGYAFSGIGHTIVTQRNMKVHLIVAAIALILCAVLQCTATEWALVITFIALVFAAEIFNTAIEAMIDLVSPEYSLKAKFAKDAAAGAVLVLAIAAVAVGLIIYISALMRLL